jgi:hypothetical protein
MLPLAARTATNPVTMATHDTRTSFAFNMTSSLPAVAHGHDHNVAGECENRRQQLDHRPIRIADC